ncbi:ABC transporter substrate-binding protein [Bosea sp. BIWAKO-01]|uniref:ABC transporter substrate-binding protein n=1 Tax=Bosea sp. BIWAKO-01 TaxID=506668 RepID=UPI00086ACACF|nr:ABC transporter substrate-binding protein [Bosea sp. BIWAKO-01]GAU82964.1 hypothetical protein BIWAKO_02887 [Bosea sp. BIWAKO-01]
MSSLPLDTPIVQARLQEIRQRLAERGWIEGQNLRLGTRFSGSSEAELAQAAAELVRENPDIIIVSSSAETAAVLALTRTMPVLFGTASDPVGSGFVRSLERPDGNATGFSNNDPVMADKWLELLTEIAPETRRVGVVFNPRTTPAAGETYLARLRRAAAADARLSLGPVAVMDANGIEGAIAEFAGQGSGGGLVFLPDSFTFRHAAQCAKASARYRLPAIYPFDTFTRQGGLMSYTGGRDEASDLIASYSDLILRGANVAELPVQFSRSFELVINEMAAASLGLSVPLSLRIRATRIVS